MKIAIFASIWAQNLWDELILKNEIKVLREKYWKTSPLTHHPGGPSLEQSSIHLDLLKGEGDNKDLKFIVFSYDTKNPFFEAEDIEYKEYFPIWLKNPKNIFKNIKNFFVFLWTIFTCNLIVIWWWGLFFDNEAWNKKNPLDLWIFRMRFFNFFLKKIYFFRIWLSIKKQESFEKIYKIFSGKRKIIEVRDNYSLKVLQDLGIEGVIKKYDPVFWNSWKSIDEILNKKVCIKKIFKNFNIKDLQTIDFKNKKVGIAFRSGYLTKDPELEILMVKEIIEFIQKFWAKVVFLPHSFSKQDILSNDFEWMKLIASKLKDIEIAWSMQETYDFYRNKKLDLVLAQRLHSIILSQVYEIPFIWISYSKKTSELLNELK